MRNCFLAICFSFSCFCDRPADYFFFSPQEIHTHVKNYTPEEMLLIEKDLAVVKSICFENGKEGQKKPRYLATAGAPCSGASAILERFLREYPQYANSIYLDPDQRGLKFMSHTYHCRSLNAFESAQEIDFSLVTKKAYEKWRGASNYITLCLLEEAFGLRYNIVHGTTSTGEHIPAFFKRVKEKKYDIVLLICSCENSLRRKALSCRVNEQKFYQVTLEDVVSKAKLFTLRMPTYFAFADVLYLFWNDDLFLKERLAAVLEKGSCQVKDEEALQQFIRKYEEDRKALKQEGRELPAWEALLKQYQERFSSRFVFERFANFDMIS